MKEYAVTYVTKKDRKEKTHLRFYKAKTAKEAREKFDRWRANREAKGKLADRVYRVKVELFKQEQPEPLNAVRNFRVSFEAPGCGFDPEYYEFLRGESGAFAYGNRSSVVVYRGASKDTANTLVGIYDTRYDHDVMSNFSEWCREWLRISLDPAYQPKIMEA